MSALLNAVARSFSVSEQSGPALSPLRALGRRQLSGYEVFAQSLATTAPAASMVVLPTLLIEHSNPLGGVLIIVLATAAIALIGRCVARFTTRMVAAGGLYSFVIQGLGARGALITGAAMLTKYVVSASMTMYHGGVAVAAVAAALGLRIDGAAPRFVIYAVLALVFVGVLIRGVRVAALVILVVECCSLAFIVGLMVVSHEPRQSPVVDSAASPGVLPVILAVTFALAGFESATFLGPEAKRPYRSVTRSVTWTPVICGCLFIFAAWATWSGRSGTVVNAYLHGTATGVNPVVVLVVQLALTTSWLASSMASSNAASRLLYTMGVERVLPSGFARVHRRYRTPAAAVGFLVGAAATGAVVIALVGRSTALPQLQPVARVAIVLAYVLVALASWRFLRRLGEQTLLASVGSVVAAGIGSGVLVVVAGSNVPGGHWAIPTAAVGIVAVGIAWWAVLRWIRPGSLLTIGAFDRPGTGDVLPGAGVFRTDAAGDIVLVGERSETP